MAVITQQELDNRLDKAASTLRSHVDEGDYKNFVFPMLFWKWISDNWEHKHALAVKEWGDMLSPTIEADYHAFDVPDGTRWSQVFGNKDVPQEIKDNRENPLNPEKYIGSRVRTAMQRIENANTKKLSQIFGDANYSNKDKIPESTLRALMKTLDSLTLNEETTPGDLMGNAYEYLLKQFADDAGQRAGQFFTPRSVVRLMVQILQPQGEESIYDPTCGSGGMLIESVNAVNEAGGDARTLRIYGQESKFTTQGMARMNLFMHQLPDHDIRHGDTIANPRFKEPDGSFTKFDAVIANPPFSIDEWDRDLWDKDPRNFGGTPPQDYADLVFVQHMISSIKEDTGRVATVMPHGVLFRSNKGESSIREKFIEDDLLEAVIGMPNNIFYGTSIPSCIMVFRKEKDEKRKKNVIFIDAQARFKKGSPKNDLGQDDIEAILSAYRDIDDAEDTELSFDDGIEGIEVRAVPKSEIKENDYDLTIGRYVAAETDVEIDVESAIAKWNEAREIRQVSEDTLIERMKGAGFIAE